MVWMQPLISASSSMISQKPDATTMTPVSGGQPYRFSLDVKGDVGKSVRLEVLWHSRDGAFLETSLGPIFFLPLGDFSGTEFSTIAPEGAGLFQT